MQAGWCTRHWCWFCTLIWAQKCCLCRRKDICLRWLLKVAEMRTRRAMFWLLVRPPVGHLKIVGSCVFAGRGWFPMQFQAFLVVQYCLLYIENVFYRPLLEEPLFSRLFVSLDHSERCESPTSHWTATVENACLISGVLRSFNTCNSVFYSDVVVMFLFCFLK